MITRLDGVLSTDAVRRILGALELVEWEDGRASANGTAAAVKRNQQAKAPAKSAILECATMILTTLMEHHELCTSVLPASMSIPCFSKTHEGGGYGWHIDTPIMAPRSGGPPLRTDVSGTIFLSEPGSYQGGELEVEGEEPAKLTPGSIALYPSDRIHRVREVTSGERLVAVVWFQSNVRCHADREILKELLDLRSWIEKLAPGSMESIRLGRARAALLRRWTDPP